MSEKNFISLTPLGPHEVTLEKARENNRLYGHAYYRKKKESVEDDPDADPMMYY